MDEITKSSNGKIVLNHVVDNKGVEREEEAAEVKLTWFTSRQETEGIHTGIKAPKVWIITWLRPPFFITRLLLYNRQLDKKDKVPNKCVGDVEIHFFGASVSWLVLTLKENF